MNRSTKRYQDDAYIESNLERDWCSTVRYENTKMDRHRGALECYRTSLSISYTQEIQDQLHDQLNDQDHDHWSRSTQWAKTYPRQMLHTDIDNKAPKRIRWLPPSKRVSRKQHRPNEAPPEPSQRLSTYQHRMVIRQASVHFRTTKPRDY